MPDEPPTAYDRGVAAGEIAARLAGHDKHFAAINGHLADMSESLHGLRLAVQRLGDQAEANQSTVLTTATALKDAEEARRDKSEQTWSPWQKLFAGLGAAAALTAVIGLIVALSST